MTFNDSEIPYTAGAEKNRLVVDVHTVWRAAVHTRESCMSPPGLAVCSLFARSLLSRIGVYFRISAFDFWSEFHTGWVYGYW